MQILWIGIFVNKESIKLKRKIIRKFVLLILGPYIILRFFFLETMSKLLNLKYNAVFFINWKTFLELKSDDKVLLFQPNRKPLKLNSYTELNLYKRWAFKPIYFSIQEMEVLYIFYIKNIRTSSDILKVQISFINIAIIYTINAIAMKQLITSLLQCVTINLLMPNFYLRHVEKIVSSQISLNHCRHFVYQ